MEDSPRDPLQLYRARLQERDDLLRQLDARDRWLSVARLVVVAAGLVAAWAVFDPERLALPWLLVPIVVFLALVVLHDRLTRRREGAVRAANFYRSGIDRMEDRWAGKGPTGDEFSDVEHPYARDLDLFGDGSLFQRLCSARTGIGRSTLAGWLLEPAAPPTATARQRAVTELSDRIDLRERLAIIADDLRGRLHPGDLSAWAEAAPVVTPPWFRWLAPLAVGFTAASLAGWIAGLTPRALFLVAVLAQGALVATIRRQVHEILGHVDRASQELGVLSGVLALMEAQEFESPLLVETARRLESKGAPPSARIASLRRLTVLLDSRRNQFFAPIGLLLMWTTQVTLATERWRVRHGRAVGRWLSAVGDFEALSSLAGYRFERPEDTFPELSEGKPSFVARGIGHPLLPAAQCVRNDVELGGGTRLLVVSGSNMSGKSTLMRTIGINAVLAQAGACVRAETLSLSWLRVGGSIRLEDSLRKGMSGFYAEIHRLRNLVEMAGQEPPLLFLLEELLSTTNSHDRRIGARAVLGSLIEQGAIGLVTTHDLALTALAGEIDGVRNVHFVDHLEDGVVQFDYRLRDGVVDRSNAVELMRSIGLDV
jgi:hypothetical protein